MMRFAEGDLDAFEELYSRYERPVFGFCLRLVGDRDAAADAFQELFLRVVESRSSYSDTGPFRAWLFTVARNVCIDRLRRDRSMISLHEVPQVASGDASVARAAEVRDELGRILGELTPERREIILLHKYHGFSHGEIAEITGSTEAAVKQKMYRALLDLREREGGER